MTERSSTVTSKGQVTIPGELRRVLDIKPGDRVAFALVDGALQVWPAGSTAEATYGSVNPIRRPEDFRKLRQDFEEGMAEEAWRED